MTRVVLWTDWVVPTLAFDVYLGPSDTQTINVRDLFSGIVPSTGQAGQLSAFAHCGIRPPFHTGPALDANEIAQLRSARTGRPGPLDSRCAGQAHGDLMARGYITVDVVDECSGIEGHAPMLTRANTTRPYFHASQPHLGIAIIDNVLWGDVLFLNRDNDSAQGSEAVAIWADAEDVPKDTFSFYGRYSKWDGRDHRAALPEDWLLRFFNGGPFGGGAEVIVWQTTEVPQVTPVACGDAPRWWPLANWTRAMDEEGAREVTLESGSFPLATQRAAVSSLRLEPAAGGGAIPYPFGRLIFRPFAQSWVQPVLSATDRFSAAFNATYLPYRCDEINLFPPSIPVACQKAIAPPTVNDNARAWREGLVFPSGHRSRAGLQNREVASTGAGTRVGRLSEHRCGPEPPEPWARSAIRGRDQGVILEVADSSARPRCRSTDPESELRASRRQEREREVVAVWRDVVVLGGGGFCRQLGGPGCTPGASSTARAPSERRGPERSVGPQKETILIWPPQRQLRGSTS